MSANAAEENEKLRSSTLHGERDAGLMRHHRHQRRQREVQKDGEMPCKGVRRRGKHATKKKAACGCGRKGHRGW
eukprot:2022453-Prymnesium_polylepis.1